LGLDEARPTSGAARPTSGAARPTSGAARPTVPGVEDVTVADGTAPPWEPRWRRRPEDLDDLLPLQRALLTSAVDLVRPGGVVVYATCSPVLAETRDVLGSMLLGRDDVTIGDVGSL